jgi:pimeloyl-ACP methyl ester carboxylesterase
LPDHSPISLAEVQIGNFLDCVQSAALATCALNEPNSEGLERMTMSPQITVDLGGTQITYRDQGSGDVLVFLHGLAGNSRSWKSQFETFGADHRVIAWDAPGFGGSDCIAPDAENFADTLNSFLESLNIDQVCLTGHSMGGIVAGCFAAKYPKRVKALLLSCTFWGGEKPKGDTLGAGYQARVDSLKTIPAEDYGKQRAAAMLADGTEQAVVDLAASIAAETRADGLENAARMLQEADNRERLKTLEMPVTVLNGELDPVIKAETTKKLAAMIPGASRITIKGAGHAPYLEFPNEYNAAVRRAFGLSG